MAIVYKISWLSYFILRFLVSIDRIGLVNIVADKDVVKEFLQGKARPGKIAEEILHILSESPDAKSVQGSELLSRSRRSEWDGVLRPRAQSPKGLGSRHRKHLRWRDAPIPRRRQRAIALAPMITARVSQQSSLWPVTSPAEKLLEPYGLSCSPTKNHLFFRLMKWAAWSTPRAAG